MAFGAYLSTLAPSITWRHGSGDSGELATAAFYLGVAHPTGYPLYVLLGWLFSHLPVGSAALGLNLLSAVSGAMAVALLAAVVMEGQRHNPPLVGAGGAATGALLLAFSPLFWSQASVTEVYALGSLFVLLTLWLQQRLAHSDRVATSGALVGLALGLGAANHVTTLFLLPGALLLLGARLRTSPAVARRALALFCLALLPGAALYLLLPWRAAAAPAYASWGDVRTWDALLLHVTGAAYRGALFSLPPEVVLTRVPAMARMLLEQFGWHGYLLSLVGAWSLAHAERAFFLSWLVSLLLFVGFALNYPVLDSQVYLLPFYLLVAVAMAWGAATLLAEVVVRAPVFSLPVAGALLLVAGLVVGAFVSSRPKVDESGDWEAYQYARSTLDALPQGSLLFTNEDRHTFSLWYLEYVEGYRRDVMVLDVRLLSWPWYQRNIFRTYPELARPPGGLETLDEVRGLVAANLPLRPVYLTFGNTSLPVIEEGALSRVDPARLEEVERLRRR
ncbi:MAG: DUF2723 domain-containing protein [Chloroflexi bacterium]|nr:DUF2723 domain-containing protein [Chloroflexota bacterium]